MFDAKFSAEETEIGKSKCPVCHKEFSSIWVLKAHSEEIHNQVSMLWNILRPEFTNVRNKLECFALQAFPA